MVLVVCHIISDDPAGDPLKSIAFTIFPTKTGKNIGIYPIFRHPNSYSIILQLVIIIGDTIPFYPHEIRLNHVNITAVCNWGMVSAAEQPAGSPLEFRAIRTKPGLRCCSGGGLLSSATSHHETLEIQILVRFPHAGNVREWSQSSLDITSSTVIIIRDHNPNPIPSDSHPFPTYYAPRIGIIFSQNGDVMNVCPRKVAMNCWATWATSAIYFGFPPECIYIYIHIYS